ncbi:hypothetical protein JCM24511_03514 [Saitozyma sp. JCM 24511]|nr:hypothetical protein JCM24511_03514 [Saitozyma sp. JCM 24511]
MAVPVQPSSLAHPLPPPVEGSPFEHPRYKEIETYLRGFADKPKPDQWQEWWQREMSRIHLLILSMLERVYRFAAFAKESDDVLNFLAYAEISVGQVYNHHALEEVKIFPAFAKAAGEDLWEGNVAQHHAFAPALDALWNHLHTLSYNLSPPKSKSRSPFPALPSEVSSIDLSQFPLLSAAPTSYDPTMIRNHMDSFVLVLAEHLHDEIDSLHPDKIEKVGKKEDERIRSDVLAHLKKYDPAWFLCAAMNRQVAHPPLPHPACLPNEEIKKALPLPWIVRRVLVPFVFGPKHAGAWRYAPYPENLTWSGSA